MVVSENFSDTTHSIATLVILSKAKDPCTLRQNAQVLQPTNYVGLRMTR
jgi:hypothetical protein